MSNKELEKENIIESEDIPRNTKKTLSRLFKFLGPQRGKIIFVTILVILTSVLFATLPILVGNALNNIVNLIQSSDESLRTISAVINAIKIPVILIIVVSILTSLISYIQQYIMASVGENLILRLRREIMIKINKLPLSYFDKNETGDIMSKVTNDLEKVSMVMQTGLTQFISSVLTIVISLVAMTALNFKLTIIFLIFIGISVIATKYLSEATQNYYAKDFEARGNLSGKIEEVYSGNNIIKIFNYQKKVIEDVSKLNKIQYEANKKAQFLEFIIYPLIRTLNQIGFVVVAILGAIMVIRGQMSLGIIQAFLQYINQVSEPITAAGYIIMSLQSAIAGAERVFELLDEEEEVSEVLEENFPVARGKVVFEDVKFGYTPDKILIKKLNLEVNPNSMVAIVGPTGAGKTTLINLIMRFYELNSGKITIDGIDTKSVSRKALRRKIGMVLQDTWLFEGTIAENIAYGRRDATREEIIEAAKAANCHHFIRTLPKGYDTIISSENSIISQGEMQLLTIARAMLTNPILMILDEATSSVDTRTEVKIQKALNNLMKDRTSFVIAHRLSTIENADTILVVKDGDIIEKGNHESLLAKNGFYASLYNSQFEEVS